MILSIMTLEVTRMVPCLIDVEEDEENEKDFSPWKIDNSSEEATF